FDEVQPAAAIHAAKQRSGAKCRESANMEGPPGLPQCANGRKAFGRRKSPAADFWRRGKKGKRKAERGVFYRSTPFPARPESRIRSLSDPRPWRSTVGRQPIQRLQKEPRKARKTRKGGNPGQVRLSFPSVFSAPPTFEIFAAREDYSICCPPSES